MRLLAISNPEYLDTQAFFNRIRGVHRGQASDVITLHRDSQPSWNGPPGYFGVMDENRARQVVDGLRDRGVDAHLARAGVYQFGVSVSLPEGREAVWDTDGTAGLEAQVMRNGMLVGFVPVIDASETFDERQIIDAITGTDYDQPVARRRTAPSEPAQPLPRPGGVFRRFLDGFRYR